jgi:hypothetical protein
MKKTDKSKPNPSPAKSFEPLPLAGLPSAETQFDAEGFKKTKP